STPFCKSSPLHDAVSRFNMMEQVELSSCCFFSISRQNSNFIFANQASFLTPSSPMQYLCGGRGGICAVPTGECGPEGSCGSQRRPRRPPCLLRRSRCPGHGGSRGQSRDRLSQPRPIPGGGGGILPGLPAPGHVHPVRILRTRLPHP